MKSHFLERETSRNQIIMAEITICSFMHCERDVEIVCLDIKIKALVQLKLIE